MVLYLITPPVSHLNCGLLKVMKLIRDLTATGYAGEGYVGTLHGEGSIEAQKISMYREYDINRCVDYVKKLLKIYK